MAIQHEEVLHIAQLARLELTATEVERMTHDLGQILGYVETLKGIDVTGIEPTTHPVPLSIPLRDDELIPSLPAEKSLVNAPSAQDGYFKVPKIIE